MTVLVVTGTDTGIGKSRTAAALLHALARSGPELREGVGAFLEKRDPAWVAQAKAAAQDGF